MKKFLIRIAVVFISLFAFVIEVSAHDLSDYIADNTTIWTFCSGTNKHAGTKSFTYKFENDDVKTTYESDIINGAKLWGSLISVSYSKDSTQGYIYCETVPDSTVIASTTNRKSSNGHYISWGICINKPIYDKQSSGVKNHAIAHEFGHVYGLGHCPKKDSIVYESVGESSYLSAVSSTDKIGMNTMTHAHTHTSASYTYEMDYSGGKVQFIHKKRCTTCKAYVEEAHTLSSSSGKCICGFFDTSS